MTSYQRVHYQEGVTRLSQSAQYLTMYLLCLRSHKVLFKFPKKKDHVFLTHAQYDM